MRLAFLITTLAMLIMLVGMFPILAEADLDSCLNISGNGSIDLAGPGNYSTHGWAVCENLTICFKVNESMFERRI